MTHFCLSKWFQNLPKNNTNEFSAGVRSFLNNNNNNNDAFLAALIKVVAILIMGGGEKDDLKKYHHRRHPRRGGETTFRKRFALYCVWFLALSVWTRRQISNRFTTKMTMHEDESNTFQNNNEIVLSHERCDDFDLDENFSFSTSSSTQCTCERGYGGAKCRDAMCARRTWPRASAPARARAPPPRRGAPPRRFASPRARRAHSAGRALRNDSKFALTSS